MTPEERKGALVGLLGRLRTNAGTRLPKRSGDEEEFVPKSVIAARAAAQSAEAETAGAALEATRVASAGHPHPGALDAAVADVERPRFAPDDVPLDTDPPPTAIPGSSPATLEEALQQAEQVELDRIAAEEAARADSANEESAPPTPRNEVADEAPSIEMGDSAELELDLLDPFDDVTSAGTPEEIEALALESEPPPPKPAPPRVAAQPPPRPAPPAPPALAAPPAAPPAPPAPPASLTRAIPMRASPTIESRAVVPPPAPAPLAPAPPAPAPPAPGPAKLRPPSPSQPDDKLAPPAPRPPAPSSPGSSPRAAAPPAPAAAAVPAPSPSTPEAKPTAPRPAERAAHPPPISRVEPISSKPGSIELPFDEQPFDEQTEERGDVTASAPADDVLIRDELEDEDDDDELSRTVNMPKRAVDPLAQTAQNPIPAAFERAVLRAEGTHVPSTDAPPASPVGSTAEPAAEEPVSSKQPRALDREGGEIDEALRADDADDAPQSGEIASQRQPSTGPHRDDLDLDGATPPSDQADAVANEALALLEAEAVPSAPPATRPAVMGRRPVAVTSFLDVLDDALSLGE